MFFSGSCKKVFPPEKKLFLRELAGASPYSYVPDIFLSTLGKGVAGRDKKKWVGIGFPIGI